MVENLEPVLKDHPFFGDLAADFLALLAGCATNVRFRSGQVVAKEGAEADRFYLIREGKIAVEVFVPGRGPLTIQTLGSGEVLGSSWLFPPYRWNFDARAVVDTRAIALDGKCLREKCENNHDLGYELMKRFSLIMAERLRATRLQLLDVYGSAGG